jgi:hypothetical protein
MLSNLYFTDALLLTWQDRLYRPKKVYMTCQCPSYWYRISDFRNCRIIKHDTLLMAEVRTETMPVATARQVISDGSHEEWKKAEMAPNISESFQVMHMEACRLYNSFLLRNLKEETIRRTSWIVNAFIPFWEFTKAHPPSPSVTTYKYLLY